MANYSTITLTEVERSNLYSEFNNKTLNLDTVGEKDPRYKEFVNQTTGQNILVNALRAGNYSYLNNVPDSYRGQESFMLPLLFAVKNGPNVTFAVFSYFSPELQNDPELGKLIIKDEPHLINNTPLASNKEFIIENAKYYPAILQYVSPTVAADPTFKHAMDDINTRIQTTKESKGNQAIPSDIIAATEIINQNLQGNTNKEKTVEEDQEVYNNVINVNFVSRKEKRNKSVADVEEEIENGDIQEEHAEQAIFAAKVREGTATIEDLNNIIFKYRMKLEKMQSTSRAKDFLTIERPEFSPKQFDHIIDQLEAQGVDVTEYLDFEKAISQEWKTALARSNDIIFEEFRLLAPYISQRQGKECDDLIKRIIPDETKDLDKKFGELWKLIIKRSESVDPEEAKVLKNALDKSYDYTKRVQKTGTINKTAALKKIIETIKTIDTESPTESDDYRENLIKLKLKIIEKYTSFHLIDSKKLENVITSARCKSEDFDISDLDLLYDDEPKKTKLTRTQREQGNKDYKRNSSNTIGAQNVVDTKESPQPNQEFRDATTEKPQQTAQPEPSKSTVPTTLPERDEAKKGTPADITEMTKGLSSRDITDTIHKLNSEKAITTERESQTAQDI